MIRNYLKTAFRNLWRNKNFTFINIAGLAVGIAVCLVIFLVVQFELSFDNFHTKKNRIYRVITELHGEDGVNLTSGIPFPLPTAMHQDFPSMKSTGIYSIGDDQIVIPDEKGVALKKFKEETGVFFAEPGFFEIFNFPLIAGDYKSLKDPNNAVITKETAEKYFGNWQSAIGKSFKRNGTQLFNITGVLATIPSNTDFQLKIVASYSTLKNYTTSTDWNSVSSNHMCYVLLPEGMTAEKMNDLFKPFVKKYKKDEMTARDAQFVQSLSEVHYSGDMANYLHRTISKKLINTLWLIATFILLIACINFINLSTAQAVNRSKEVAVRKVLGSNSHQLKLQFYSETAFITICAIILAVFISLLAIPFLRTILELPIEFNPGENTLVIPFLIIVAIIVVLLAGFYPAIVLSRFNPITALKSKVTMGRTKGVSLRRALVVFQFMVAQALIIGTLIVVKQMDYFRSKPLGFDKHAIVNVSFPGDSTGRSKLNYLKDKLSAIRGVKSVSFSFASPAETGNWYSNFRFNHAEKEVDWGANLKWADTDYLKTYGLKLIAGRNILPSDTVREYIVNETLLKKLGIVDPQEALNKEIEMWGGQMKGPIVGVLQDFNSISLREAMAPVLLSTVKDFYSIAGIKMESQAIPEVLKKVESLWNETYPEFVYEQKFLDAKIEDFYKQENKLSQLYKIFAVLAIFLSCLGLYGLASFMAVQRVKEVGIRKVLGASVKNIIMLFSKEFLVLIAIAFVIATPIAWYFMHEWLQDFVYRINISWWVLLLAGVLAGVVALFTISFQAVKAAFANPVKSLRTE